LRTFEEAAFMKRKLCRASPNSLVSTEIIHYYSIIKKKEGKELVTHAIKEYKHNYISTYHLNLSKN